MEVKQINKIKKIIAGNGKIIVSKSTHIDEETGKKVYDIQGKIVYLGKYDSEENYIEIDDIENIN